MGRLWSLGAAALLAVSVGTPTLAQQDTSAEELAQREQQVSTQLLKIEHPLTVYDYVTFSLSGPVVVLHGFSTKPTVKEDAEKVVRELDWVTHVVNQIDFVSAEPAANDIRKETYSILRKACPQAFPSNRAYVRIKVDKGLNVKLVGTIGPEDQKRLEAAVVQIKQIPLVGDVENEVKVREKAG